MVGWQLMSEQNNPWPCLRTTEPPPTTLRGILELPQLEGYLIYQPEPCSSLHYARIVAAAFKLRVSPARCSSKVIIMSHHLVQWEFGMTSSTCHYSPKMALLPPHREPHNHATYAIHGEHDTASLKRHCHRFTRPAPNTQGGIRTRLGRKSCRCHLKCTSTEAGTW